MRKWFSSLAVLGLASAAATAQTLGPPPPVGGCGQSQSLLFDDGTAETSWKVSSPERHTDAFNVDFDDLAGNMTVTGIALNTWTSNSGLNAGMRQILLCPDNLAVSSLGKTPDLFNPLSKLGNRAGTIPITGGPTVSSGYCPGFRTYDIPDVTVPTTGGVHTVLTFLTGDSSVWLCSDVSSQKHHSYFTSSSYQTPASAVTGNLMMRIVGNVTPPSGGSAYMTVQNSAGNVKFSETDTVVVTLWSTAAVQPTFYLEGVLITGFPFIPVPQIIMQTGTENFFPSSDPFSGSLCGPAGPPCGFAGIGFGFGAFYIDNADLKKNGNGKIKSTNFVPCLVTPGSAAACNPCLCFGQSDDGFMDGTIWKVQSPAGPADYFNTRIRHDDGAGGPCANPTTILSVQAASWDFCGTGPSWGSVGVYQASTSLGSNTPDLSAPIVTATTLAMAPNAGDWSYPATTYDFPDVNSSTNSALANSTVMHVAMGWPPGDSCIWIGSDRDGIDDDSTSTGSCTTAPSTVSFFTLNGYTSAAALLPSNMMMRIDWL